MRDLGDFRARVTLVTTSEFGARVTENGTGGQDTAGQHDVARWGPV
jgi:uncharacterized protein (DUF1501 family)